MKKVISILMIILFANFSQAQTNNYANLWKKVEQLENKGLVQSAHDAVEAISKQAKADKNTTQIIKTLIYKSKYALTLQEEAQLKIINDFKTEIDNSTSPTKNLLENMLANLYWQYFNEHRWQFYNRTKTEDKVDALDFRTWDLQTLFTEIDTYFKRSLENGLLLQQTPLKIYDDILHVQENSKIFRPTLFDLLHHNALEFYKTDEHHITKPAYKFEIDDPKYLSEASVFSKLKITSKDSASLQLQALKIFQDIIRFHSKDKSPEALTEVNIERLKFVKQHATFSDKDALFLKTVQKESETYKNHVVSGLYNYEVAAMYTQEGNTYNPKTNPDTRWKLKEALTLCNAIQSKFPESRGALKCTVLKEQLLQKQLQINAENHLPIQQNSRLLISYKNIDQVKFKLYTLNHKQSKQFHKTYGEKEQRAFLKKLDISKQWQNSLRNENDYQNHTTEVIFPKLGNGLYLIVAEVPDTENIFAFKTIQVTNLAVTEHNNGDETKFQVINRINGKPIPNAKLKVSYQKGHNGKTQTVNLIADKYGEAKLTKTAIRYINVNIEVTYLNETAYFGNYYVYNHYNNRDDKDNVSYDGFLFTDRSIYRPGQTVYFKGIAMKTRQGKSDVLVNEKIRVSLFDVNYQKLKTQEYVTNDFGSLSGEFILPSSGLTGEFYIELESNSKDLEEHVYISVEEYKRPKFEASFNPITNTYRVNDAVTVKGHALAYAGSHITQAKVVYRVHRKVQYPRWFYWYRPAFHSEPQEIIHGESKTNDKGEFEITFKAIPDESVDQKDLPVFHYEVTADVTDLNGETRSATTIVNVGYHALLANMSLADKLNKNDKDHKISIDTKNLNNEFVPATGTIKIYKLQAPDQVLRARPWQAPDYQDIPETEFRNKFPHEAYRNEQDQSTWKKGKLVFEKAFNTQKSKDLELGNIKKWKSGVYIVLLESKDQFGQTVKDEIKTTLYSDKDNTLADNQLFSITTDKAYYNPGDTAIITLGSAAQDIYVTVDIEKEHLNIEQKVIHLNNDKKTIEIPVTPKDIGGFALHYSFCCL